MQEEGPQLLLYCTNTIIVLFRAVQMIKFDYILLYVNKWIIIKYVLKL